MVQAQIISKVLNTKDISILEDNAITLDYFTEYGAEAEYILNHKEQYGNVPNIETFLEKFPEFTLLETTESDRYLVDTIREEYLYAQSVPIVKQYTELLKADANEAARYLQEQTKILNPNYTTPYEDIIHSRNRVEVFKDKSENKDKWFIPTGFEELDDIIGGWQVGEEYVVFYARTGQGKSWIVVKIAQHAWLMGKNVGYFSPEMSPDRIGYRFDTMNKNISNRSLTRGDTNNLSVDDYNAYMDELAKHTNKFLVTTPRDFNNSVTVSKLKGFVKTNNLDMLVIDGITYLSDERYHRGDSKTISLTNISEDLMQLSCELKIPVIVVVQSNRGGVKEDKNATPELEDIRDSDGISHNATKVISLRQKDDGLIMSIKKNRDGATGAKLTYLWDIDNGRFTYLPTDDSSYIPPSEPQNNEDKPKYVF